MEVDRDHILEVEDSNPTGVISVPFKLDPVYERNRQSTEGIEPWVLRFSRWSRYPLATALKDIGCDARAQVNYCWQLRADKPFCTVLSASQALLAEQRCSASRLKAVAERSASWLREGAEHFVLPVFF